MERVYDTREEYYFLRPKPQTEIINKTVSKPKWALPLVPQTESKPKDNIKDIIKTIPTTKANPSTKPKDNIYSRIKNECKKCHAEFKKKIALTTQSYSHNCKYLENTEYFDINPSQHMKEFYITDKAGNYIEDIDEAINNSLEEIKPVTSFVKLSVLKIKSQPSVSTRREPKKKLRSQNYSLTLTILLIMQYMIMVTSNNGWILKNKYMKAMPTALRFSD